MSHNDLQLAGYAREADGTYGRDVPSGYVIVPETVEIHGNSIRWDLGRYRKKEVSRGTLNGFIRLWKETPTSIRTFAHNWGVLVMHGDEISRPCGILVVRGEDPIDAWRYYSRRASAVLSIAASLRLEKLGDLQDWGKIVNVNATQPSATVDPSTISPPYGLRLWDTGVPTTADNEHAIDQAREIVSQELRAWLSFWRTDRTVGLSDFTVHWNLKSRRWELGIDYHTFLFAALALQLAMVVAEADNLYICSGCCHPYVRDQKRPKAGWANYCQSCSNDGASKRKAVENYRVRKAEALRLSQSGVSVSEIADSLAVDPIRIKSWLERKAENAKAKTRK